MARGSEAKEKITKQILETFEGSFPYDKEIRIPVEENGEIVQIKVTLTCAKVNVSNGGDQVVPAEIASPVAAETDSAEITEEEKKDVKTMLESFGF